MEGPAVPSHRARRLLATLVGGVCLLAGCAGVTLLGGASAGEARAGAQPAQAQLATAAQHAHSGDLGVPGMSEQELRAFETATLGPEHAREHALMRAAMSKAESDPAASEDPGPRIAAVAEAAAAEAPGDPVDVGRWEAAKTPFPIVAIHAAMLPTGKVMFFSYPTYPGRPNNAEAYLWDPAHPEQPPVLKNPPGKANIWCAGQTFLANGELLVFGGNLDYENPSATWKGLDQVFTFNPWTETWTEQPRMGHGRWYPTGVRMADGRVPILSGLDETGLLDPFSHTNLEVELFTPSGQLGGLGSIEKIGRVTWDATEQANGLPPAGDLYPRMIAMASGRVLLAGPDQASTWFIDDVDQNPFTWDDAPALTRARTWGTAVPLPSGAGGPTKVMALGGTEWSGEPSTTTTEIFDESNPGSWQAQTGKDNVYGRGHANTVLLPDGSMVEVGGGRGSLSTFASPLHYAEPQTRHIELWDPASRTWRLGPAQTEARAYHSTALLLPDGRVMSAGDDWNGDPGDPDKADQIDTDPAEDTAEIYEPPYLFRGPRPTISQAPQTIGFNGSFGVNTPDTNISGAALAAPAAVTHGVDMNQRMLELDVVQRTGCVSVTAPTGPNAAPPGFYMLFLLNDQGVPSIAKFVELKQGGSLGGCATAPPPDLQNPTVRLDAPGAGTVAGTIDVTATASDDRGVVGVEFRRDGVLLTDDKSSPYATTWNTTNVADGQHTVTATARDAAGKTTTASVTVTVENTDTDGPSVNITSPATGATITGVTPVAAGAGDPSGVQNVQFKVDGANIGAPDASAPYSVDWASINVPNGSHALTAVATDMLGNQRTSAQVSVTVQNADGVHVDPLPPKNPPNRPGPPGGGETPGGGSSGGGGSGGGSNPPAAVAPSISRLKLSPASFRRGRDTLISFTLSESARVVVAFERKLGGRRVRGRCVAGARKGSRCTAYARARKTFKVQGKAGANRLLFPGSASRRFSAGSWRLVVQGTDSTGKRSRVVYASFKLMDTPVKKVRAAALRWF